MASFFPSRPRIASGGLRSALLDSGASLATGELADNGGEGRRGYRVNAGELKERRMGRGNPVRQAFEQPAMMKVKESVFVGAVVDEPVSHACAKHRRGQSVGTG